MKMETKAVHAAPGVPPACPRRAPGDGGYPRGYEYTRDSNPNWDALEECGSSKERPPRRPSPRGWPPR